METYPLNVQELPDFGPELVGNKAYNLMVMSHLGLPVPRGFVIPINSDFDKYELIQEFDLYDLRLPISVRSGAAVSMPGMMDTILNIGSNHQAIINNQDPFTIECFSRLIQSLGISVFNIESSMFHKIEKAAHDFYIDDSVAMQKKIVDRYIDLWLESGHEFPDNWTDQLWLSALAVKNSWNSQRAIDYRESEDISHESGTAIIVQEMVFGNRNDRSGTGVVFSHNPNTGKPGLYGDFLASAQGEDIVSGTKIPVSIDCMLSDSNFKRCGRELKSHIGKLLRHFKYIQDVEFTIDDGSLYILQTRSGKCSPRASIRSSLSMVNNGSMSIAEATQMVLDSLPKNTYAKITVDESSMVRVGFGIGVSEGDTVGVVACSKDFAYQQRNKDIPYIFCAEVTSPNDTECMRHASGVLTAMGGRLSHAAVLARSMSKPTVVGFELMEFNGDIGFTVDEQFIKNGDMIKIDGTTGSVYVIS